ncbi:MAG: lipoyl(octanoyl) transferase [Gammaproteobacteria bacterium]|jgi:lipoyl(octanoyl) transferase|nr:lipoyl(octanoyl) transferase [Gammaproteobacteria bacterium]
MAPSHEPLIRHLGSAPYEPIWRAMQKFTDERQDATADEIWFVEHPPVFTLGLNASREHLLAPGDIPVVQIDRGGQVTYHGPGQLMIYPLLNLRRLKLGVRDLVVALENAVISYAAELGLTASGSRQAPGVYIDGAKLASIGLRIRRGACYHGMALNVSLDPQPFERINVCGYRDLRVTRLADHGIDADLQTVAQGLTPHLLRHLGYQPNAAAPNAAAPNAVARGYKAINTDLQAVNSR